MKVLNRAGELIELSFDEIKRRIIRLCDEEMLGKIEIDRVVIATINGIYDGITTSELDDLSARISASLQSVHFLYDKLAARIVVSNMEKNMRTRLSLATHEKATFSFKTSYVANHSLSTLDPLYARFVAKNAAALDAIVDYSRDAELSYFALRTLEKSYLTKIDGAIVESPQDMWMRVAVAIAKPLQGDRSAAVAAEDVARIYDAMSKGDYTHATPTLFNAGMNISQCSSCYLLGTDDSLGGIFKTISDCAQISKWAGGIGVHVSNVRAKGARIASTNGTSDGIIPMLKVYNEVARYCNQSGRRKGSIAVYLEPWHADVWEFVELRRNTGADTERARDLFLALWVPDEFMRRMEVDDDWYLMSPDACPGLVDAYDHTEGGGGPDDFNTLYNRYITEGKYVKKIKARVLWQHVITSQLETGVPYVLYKDHVNRKSNQANVGTIRSSNLCVAPETEILTDKGYKVISELKDQPVKVWNGKQFSDTVVRQTGIDQPLIRVAFSNGEELECTPYHKFYIQEPGYNSTKVNIVEAKDLQDGDIVAKFTLPVVPDTELLSGFKYPYTHGLFCADGTYLRGKPILQLYGEKKLLAEHIDTLDGSRVYENPNVRLPNDMTAKFDVPINYVLSEKLRWLEGLVDGDGCLLKTPFGKASQHSWTIQVSSVNVPFLMDVKRMLNTMGTDPKIALMKTAGPSMMPDGHGGSAEFQRQACYRLMINSGDLSTLRGLGFSPKRISLEGMETPERDARRFVTVVEVADYGRTDDTYCFTEPLEGKGVFNGILTGQCAEIVEYSDSSQYAVCNLASIAVSKFTKPNESGILIVDHERLHETAKQVTRNLNRVIDLNFYPTPETSNSNFAMRPIGVGVQGFGDLYCALKIPYDDPRAVQVDAEVMETIYHGCIEASGELAELYGPYDRFEGSPASRGVLQYDLWNAKLPSDRYDWGALKSRIAKTGMRNSLLTALMPTATTSQILGNCESFEPFQANVFKRTTLAGEFLVVNKHLMRDLMEIGLWTEDFRRQLLSSDGSVQKLADVPDDIKAVYKTVWEVPQRAVIDHAAARGPFVDQSQSMNLYMAGPSFQKLSSALVYGWKSGLKTGVYYLRSQAAVEAIKYGSASGHSKAAQSKAAKGSSPRADGAKTSKTPRTKAKAAAALAASSTTDDGPVLACRRDNPDCEACGA